MYLRSLWLPQRYCAVDIKTFTCLSCLLRRYRHFNFMPFSPQAYALILHWLDATDLRRCKLVRRISLMTNVYSAPVAGVQEVSGIGRYRTALAIYTSFGPGSNGGRSIRLPINSRGTAVHTQDTEKRLGDPHTRSRCPIYKNMGCLYGLCT